MKATPTIDAVSLLEFKMYFITISIWIVNNYHKMIVNSATVMDTADGFII